MKKILCIVLITVNILSLYGCGYEKTTITLEPFKSKIVLISEEVSSEGAFVYENENSIYIDFTSGVLQGVRVHYGNGEYRFSCDDVTVSSPENAGNLPVYGIFSAVRLLAGSDREISPGKESMFTLSDSDEEYTYTVDSSGRLVSVSAPHCEALFSYQY